MSVTRAPSTGCGPLRASLAAVLLLPIALAACASRDEGAAAEAPGLTHAPPEELPPDSHGDALPSTYRAASPWEDASQGPTATLVYVTATGTREAPRPYPVVISSDPSNTYFHRESGPGITVRRLYREEMDELLARLEAEGLSTLEWLPFDVHERIGPDRALYLYRDGACRQAVKARLGPDGRRAFTRVENRILALCGR